MRESNRPYYQRRLAEELAAAERTQCAQAAEAHREMAEIYRILLDHDGEQEDPTVVVLRPEAVARSA